MVNKLRWGIDSFLLILVAASLVLLLLFYMPVKTGFFCNDDDLKRKFQKDTVPAIALLCGTFLVAPIVIVIITLLAGILESASKSWIFAKKCLLEGLGTAFIYLYGLLCVGMITIVMKAFISSKRPYFLTACQPDFAKINCSEYITEYNCTGTDKYLIYQAQLSFPSGHTSISVYAAVFLVMVTNRRLTAIRNISSFLLPTIHLAVIMLGVLCSVSRVKDNAHFWIDVEGGALIGLGVAIYIATEARLIQRSPSSQTQELKKMPVERMNTETSVITTTTEDKM